MINVNKNARGSGIVIDAKTVHGPSPVELVVGVDAGSTQTRVALADATDAKMLLGEEYTKEMFDFVRGAVYIIPSSHALVTDEREIAPNSDNIEDNYDSHIIRVRTSAVNPILGSHRVVRGQKISDSAGLVTLYLDSSTNKMDNLTFYVNVLDGIGYAIMQQYNGQIPDSVAIHLALSVRPKELNTPCQDKMKENLIGDFIFRWGDLSINISIKDLLFTTEPEAQITGTSVIMEMAAVVTDNEAALEMADKFNNCDSYIHIEGGGSSVGVEVVKQGTVVDACSSTFTLGGNYLTKILIDRLRSVKGRMVSEESASAAIQTCLLKNGREREDISEVVAACKRQVARDIFERLRHDVIDITTDLTLRDMDFISLGGRLFAEDYTGGSIGTYFEEYVHQISPNTDVIILKDNYIPQGNMFLGLNEHPMDDTSEDNGTPVESTAPAAQTYKRLGDTLAGATALHGDEADGREEQVN